MPATEMRHGRVLDEVAKCLATHIAGRAENADTDHGGIIGSNSEIPKHRSSFEPAPESSSEEVRQSLVRTYGRQ
jgi:hypothetical protein